MLAFILLLLAVLLWIFSQRARQASGLPAGQVVYSDTGGWTRLEKPLFSAALQLTGKPDYLVRQGAAYIPVEVKSGRAPAEGPYASHVYQLAAYCTLVEAAYGRRPTHGLIKYADRTLAVDFTRTLEAELSDLLDEMRADGEAEEVERSHSSAARCRACGFRDECDESLV